MCRGVVCGGVLMYVILESVRFCLQNADPPGSKVSLPVASGQQRLAEGLLAVALLQQAKLILTSSAKESSVLRLPVSQLPGRAPPL